MYVYVLAIKGNKGNDVQKVTTELSDIYDTYNKFNNEIIDIDIKVWENGEILFSSTGEDAMNNLDNWILSLTTDEEPVISDSEEDRHKYDYIASMDVISFDILKNIMMKEINDPALKMSVFSFICTCELEGLSIHRTIERLAELMKTK